MRQVSVGSKETNMREGETARVTMSRGKNGTSALVIRVLAGGLLAGVVLATFQSLLSSKLPSGTLTIQRILVGLISGLLYMAVMAPLARRVRDRPLVRFLAIFLPIYITGTLADLVEAYFYTTLLSSFGLIAALVVEGIPILLVSAIIAWLIPASEEVDAEPSIGQAMRERSFLSWLWRICAAGVPYVLIYLGFAALVTPIERAYYNDPAFIASLHTRIPSTQLTILLEAARGVLFVLAQLPVVAILRKSRWLTALYIGLIGSAIEGWIPLLGMTTWPVAMRLGNVLELTGDAFGRALLMAVFVLLPTHAARKTD